MPARIKETHFVWSMTSCHSLVAGLMLIGDDISLGSVRIPRTGPLWCTGAPEGVKKDVLKYLGLTLKILGNYSHSLKP